MLPCFRLPLATSSRVARRVAALIAITAVLTTAAACGSQTPTPQAPSPSPSLVAVAPAIATAAPSASIEPASPSPSPSAEPSTSDSPVPSASPSPSPTPSPTPFHGRPTSTRIVIAKLGIDLAIVKAPSGYPYCNVAMYFAKPFGQPGETRATYIVAHARDGMFGPIYQLVMFRRTPNVMVGMLVDVYTSDDRVHVYRITRVLPHQLTLHRPLGVRKDQLWLQTSEGPHGTPGKTQVVADPVSVRAATHADAHPKARIVVCG